MAAISETLFKQLKTAAWLWQSDGTLLAETEAAAILQKEFQLDPHKILEIAEGNGCLKHGTQEECLDCPVAEQPLGDEFPFELVHQSGQEKMFWGSLTKADDQLLLQIFSPEHSLTDQPDRSLFEYLNNARELERKRIAQDLHDGIAQSIYSLMLETRLLKWLPAEEQKVKLAEIDTHFTEVLTEVKNLASELRPMSIDEFGLLPALEQFVQRLSEMTGFEVQLETFGSEQPLSEAKRIAIYRSVQEAVANALKYAGVNQAVVTLDFTEKLVVLVKDEGNGFSRQQQETGFGLMNMRERIQSVGGTIEINTHPGLGTTIRMVVPCDGENELEQI